MSSHSTPHHLSPPPKHRINRALRKTSRTLFHHLKHHVGVGIICSVAYFDPGNWSVDLQAGSSFGYRPMLFVILMAGLGAIVLQTLSCRLGCVTGLDLASHCRLLLHDHPKHPRLVRRLVLYPLYVLSEIAIISTDLAELLGSAIGFCLLFPKLPLWAGVVLTAVDVLIFLIFSDPARAHGRPVKLFEYTIIVLVFAVFACFVALLVKVQPDWSEVFLGYIPSKGLFQSQPDAVYSAVGILGATVMPHALFLGSSLATQDRVSLEEPQSPELPSPVATRSLKSRFANFFSPLFRVSRAERVASSTDYRSKYGERENNSYSFIKEHLTHGVADIVSSLLFLAVPINSAILILAAAVFFKGTEEPEIPAGLFDAHDLIKTHIGNAAGFIFAIALICAGQTSSITATLAGQIVSEGFIEWKISPFMRRMITRLISLIPSVVVAVAVGREGINTLLVASQVVLSVVLPFVAFPLIYLTSNQVVMRVRKPIPPLIEVDSGTDENDIIRSAAYSPERSVTATAANDDADTDSREQHLIIERTISKSSKGAGVVQIVPDSELLDYSNGRLVSWLAYIIWSVVLIANSYAIVMLAKGTTSN